MSTRSNIAILNDDNTVTAIYCHFDGYFNGVGLTLLENYQNVNKINDLISLGAISTLKLNLNPKTGDHSFKKPESGVTIAYHRDRGDELTIHKYANSYDYVNHNKYSDIDYYYLFMNGQWHYSTGESVFSILDYLIIFK